MNYPFEDRAAWKRWEIRTKGGGMASAWGSIMGDVYVHISTGPGHWSATFMRGGYREWSIWNNEEYGDPEEAAIRAIKGLLDLMRPEVLGMSSMEAVLKDDPA